MSNPTPYQAPPHPRNYFEGWYFKIVVPHRNLAYAFIPGISYDAAGRGEAFLQVLDGVAATSAYHVFPPEEFRAARDQFVLELGPHHFATDRLVINLPDLQLDLHFDRVHPWRKRPLAPGIMGPFGYLPRMQCYHGLVSYHHELRGTVTVGGRVHDAAGGIGYTEKDWGSGFPRAWVWGQSNHFSGTSGPTSLMFSFAHIPFLGTSFKGHLATFLLDGEVHLFTTWAGSRVRCEFREQGEVSLTFRKGKWQLEITGKPAPGGDLLSPLSGGGMAGKINESLRAELGVRLRRGEETLYAGVASWAGLEVSENAPEVLG